MTATILICSSWPSKPFLSEVGMTEPSPRSTYDALIAPSDRAVRPLENSLSAYEVAWSAGVRLCECDIALTADEVRWRSWLPPLPAP